MILRPFLHRRDQLGRVHQVSAVADQHEDFALSLSHSNADAGGYLVAHAGITEFEMTGPAAGCVPQLQEIAGRAAGGGDDRVAGSGFAIEQADQLALAHSLAGAVAEDFFTHLRRPLGSRGGDFCLVVLTGLHAGGQSGCTQGGKRQPGVGQDGQGALAWPRRAALALMLMNRTSG